MGRLQGRKITLIARDVFTENGIPQKRASEIADALLKKLEEYILAEKAIEITGIGTIHIQEKKIDKKMYQLFKNLKKDLRRYKIGRVMKNIRFNPNKKMKTKLNSKD